MVIYLFAYLIIYFFIDLFRDLFITIYIFKNKIIYLLLFSFSNPISCLFHSFIGIFNLLILALGFI